MKKLIPMFGGFCLAFVFQATAPAQTITNPPQSITVNNASTATFTVGASGATNYQWRFNGTNNLGDGTMGDGVVISGSATSALILEDVTSSEAGSYTVVVSNLTTSVTSSPPAVLAIVPGTIVTFTFSGLPSNAPGSNVQVQLFNHDKPVTVQNFIHYITAGAYTNMFFDWCLPGFVLQGGDYGASNQTMSTPPITGWSIDEQFTMNTNIEPPFPSGITNEFKFGPLIHNRFGTIAMAPVSGKPNSASSAFFFNLTNNSPYLDTNNGGFAVFGRILDGTNVLQYFNTLTNGSGIVTNGDFLDDGTLFTNEFTNLPVDYPGTNAPANSNLVYCGFQLTNPPGDTNPPAVSIISPTAGALLSNSLPLTVQGTAIDNNDIGLAWVRCDLIPLSNADGTLANGGVSLTNYVLGSTNWKLGFGIVAPGTYELGAQARDEATNLSTEAFVQPLTITAIITNGYGSISFVQGASSNANPVGYPLQNGIQYTVEATAGTNQIFVNWTANGYNLVNPELSFTMASGFQWTARFISNDIPNSIAFTYPMADDVLSNSTFNITGTISNVPSAQVTCQIYSATTSRAVGSPLTNNGTNSWSVAVTNLPLGSYTAEVTAVDPAGESTLITENFTISTNAPAQILSQPQSVTVNNASTATFTVGASNAVYYQWQFQGSNITGATNSVLTLEDVNSNQMGDYTVVVNGSVTSSNAVLTIVPGTIVTFTFSGFPDGGISNVDVQLFNHDKPVTVQNFIHYITAGAYTNMFFDRCLPGFVLQGGDYGASNQTMSTPPITGWSIDQQFTLNTNIEPPFPSGITNEFKFGPLIHNRFGTIAMALVSGKPNSASSAFFFNLTNNSPYLDTNNGGFAVFGRILDGTNVLQYFNTLTNGSGIVTNGDFLDDGTLFTNEFTNLPVNYPGTNASANSNLVYCRFQLTNPPVATNLPAVSIISPTVGALLSNSLPLTVQGTAIDNNDIGLAWVRCDLIPLSNADGTLPNGGVSLTNYVLGSSNWRLGFGIVAPGTYKLGAQAQDEATNLSTEVFVQPLTITAIITNGNGTISFTQGASSNANPVGYPLQVGTQYTVEAMAGTNQLFVNWTAPGVNTINPGVQFAMQAGRLLTATFISNGIPNSIAFTYPTASAIISTNAFNITGTISNFPSNTATVTCQIYSATSYMAVGPPLTNSGANTWSVAVTNGLSTGSYTIQAIAVDNAGESTLITENFTVAAKASLRLNIVGPGAVSGAANGEFIPVGVTFQVTAIPKPGQLFYTWNNGTQISTNATQTYTMASGLTLTATFVTNNISNMIAFTYPAANSIIGSGSFNITGTISNVPSAQVTCQIFSNATAVLFSQPLTAIGTANWSIGMSGLGAGSYTIVATAVDSAGDSTLISENFTVQYSGALQLIIVGKGIVAPVTNGEMLPLGTNFQVTATPLSGQVFYTWNNGTQSSTNATQTYTMASGLTLTATFIPSNTAKGISFTYPAANARLSTNTFRLKGRIASSFKPAEITCQVFQTNGLAIGSAAGGEWHGNLGGNRDQPPRRLLYRGSCGHQCGGYEHNYFRKLLCAGFCSGGGDLQWPVHQHQQPGGSDQFRLLDIYGGAIRHFYRQVGLPRLHADSHIHSILRECGFHHWILFNHHFEECSRETPEHGRLFGFERRNRCCGWNDLLDSLVLSTDLPPRGHETFQQHDARHRQIHSQPAA